MSHQRGWPSHRMASGSARDIKKLFAQRPISETGDAIFPGAAFHREAAGYFA